MRTNFRNNAIQKCNPPGRWPPASNPSFKRSNPTRTSRAFWLLPFLSLCGACAAPEPRLVQTTVYACYQREEWLEPTPEPPFMDQNLEELIEESRLSRAALRSCNLDKDKVRKLNKNQKPPPAAPGGTR